MLNLEAGMNGLNKQIIEFAISHVIRNNKRWGRYEMDLSKDLKRLKKILKRSGMRGILESEKEEVASPASVSGWCGQKKSDLVAFYGNDFLEVVAILEYWGLWQFSNELTQIEA